MGENDLTVLAATLAAASRVFLTKLPKPGFSQGAPGTN